MKRTFQHHHKLNSLSSIGRPLSHNDWNWEPGIIQSFQLLVRENKSASWSLVAIRMWPNITLGAQSPAEGKWAGIIRFNPGNMRPAISLSVSLTLTHTRKHSLTHSHRPAYRVIIHHEADRHCPLPWHGMAWPTVHKWQPETCLGLNTIHLSAT